MAESRATSAAKAPALRLEILKDLQGLIDSKEARDRIDKGPLSEVKGKEHWVLHLLLRADESSQAQVTKLITASYANLTARLQAIDDRLTIVSDTTGASRNDLESRMSALAASLNEGMEKGFAVGTTRAATQVSERVAKEIDQRWRPISESIERFSEGSKQMLKGVSDSYLIATQNRLLLNDCAKRISDLGRDLLALEDGLRLAVQRTIEESLVPLEARVARLEESATGRPSGQAAGSGSTSDSAGAA